MPRRTTEFQTIVNFVRQHTAADGVIVTESKLLHDTRLDVDREVDIVVEGEFDGEPVVTSIEVIEHARKGDLTWVEQQIGKHRYLPTNRLVLISKSGFTRSALGAVAAEGGWVEALEPRMIVRDGEPAVERLYLDQFTLRATTCKLIVVQADGTPLRVNVTETADVNVYDRDGKYLGMVFQLAQEVLNLPWLVRRFSESAHNYPERDTLKGFAAQVPIAECEYHLHHDDSDEDHPIAAIDLAGEFAYAQTELLFNIAQIGDRVFGSGKGEVFGRETVWVGTTDAEKNETRITWKALEKDVPDSAVSVPDTNSAPLFSSLLDLPTPDDWAENEQLTDGVAFYGVRRSPEDED